MSGLSRVKLIVATADGARLYSALEVAMALQALGRRVVVFFQGDAVQLLRSPISYPGDAARRAAGQPELSWMVAEATEMEVELQLCQTGMTMCNLTPRDLEPMAVVSGLIGFLASGDPSDPIITY